MSAAQASPILTLLGDPGADFITDMQYDYYGRRLATTSADGVVRVRDVAENGEWSVQEGCELKVTHAVSRCRCRSIEAAAAWYNTSYMICILLLATRYLPAAEKRGHDDTMCSPKITTPYSPTAVINIILLVKVVGYGAAEFACHFYVYHALAQLLASLLNAAYTTDITGV